MTDLVPLEMSSTPDPKSTRIADLRRFFQTIGWLVGGPYRLWPVRLTILNLVESVASVASAGASILLVLLIRTIYTGAPLGPTGITFEDPTSPTVVGLATGSLVALAAASAGAIYYVRRRLADVSMEYASRQRNLALALLRSPNAEGWQTVVDARNPAAEVTKVVVSRLRSATVALADTLGAGPAIVVFVFSIVIMASIDPIALALVLPIAIGLFLLAEGVNRRVQELTIVYDARGPKTRERFESQLDDDSQEPISFSRVETDDRLFHDRVLASERLRAFTLLSSAILLAILITYFTAIREADGAEIAAIVVYLFAARYAMASLQRVFRALVQVSRRLEDIRAFHALLFAVEDLRTSKNGPPPDELNTLTIALPGGGVVTVDRKRPMLVLLNRPVNEARVEEALRAISQAAGLGGDALAELARVGFSTDLVDDPAMLSSAPVRVIVSENGVAVAREKRNALTFIVHNKPRVVLARDVLKYKDQFAGWLLICDGEVTSGGDVEDAHGNPDGLRALHRPPRPRKGARAGRFRVPPFLDHGR